MLTSLEIGIKLLEQSQKRCKAQSGKQAQTLGYVTGTKNP